MSADFWIEDAEGNRPSVDTCAVCQQVLDMVGPVEMRAARLWNISDVVFDSHAWTVTYNLTPMLRAAGFVGWHQLIAWDTTMAGAHVTAVLHQLAVHPGRYRAMNPPNGWGSYEGLVTTLADFVKVALTHPGLPLGGWL